MCMSGKGIKKVVRVSIFDKGEMIVESDHA